MGWPVQSPKGAPDPLGALSQENQSANWWGLRHLCWQMHPPKNLWLRGGDSCPHFDVPRLQYPPHSLKVDTRGGGKDPHIVWISGHEPQKPWWLPWHATGDEGPSPQGPQNHTNDLMVHGPASCCSVAFLLPSTVWQGVWPWTLHSSQAPECSLQGRWRLQRDTQQKRPPLSQAAKQAFKPCLIQFNVLELRRSLLCVHASFILRARTRARAWVCVCCPSGALLCAPSTHSEEARAIGEQCPVCVCGCPAHTTGRP